MTMMPRFRHFESKKVSKCFCKKLQRYRFATFKQLLSFKTAYFRAFETLKKQKVANHFLNSLKREVYEDLLFLSLFIKKPIFRHFPLFPLKNSLSKKVANLLYKINTLFGKHPNLFTKCFRQSLTVFAKVVDTKRVFFDV